ncbi:tetratricopeptide repeat protein [Desertifilum sp. FACHB-1129]|uniref:Protein kinase domain-containing protein n=1 Tax=Desertifilum tharense IPPAS B-1220 TaxID=1781255 RepID=A0A1E5QM38_9CYAN|nr:MULTISPECIES: serine/threonine-protein kinase [Desertifilum]MBD2312503.1 tetratricopeptide repeat protein [Desertifilum sp. FACHB-1129]MBD2323445.1 tetratricopeptide repeat protein [Desertifilum sp. FACHB-866]MBD2333290.1 tetratricopeptide repeat protein [Desertifilum sp. FACHB-868]OEJ75671.1 hypothetical protein BH720_08505 [Desertifilum tharense IPPAS B-1220]
MVRVDMLGKTLRGRYNIIKQLGCGGFGTTFIAEDLDLPGNPWCVVKQLQAQGVDPMLFQTARRLFETEAQVLYRLGKHDRIPQLFAHFEEHQEFYLVQEYIEGEDLAQQFASGVWDEVQVLQLLEDLLEILAFVHQQNVVHRDIKPSNIIRRQADGRFVLIDFGAVKQLSALGATTTGQTRSTLSIGSPGYMPNEQQGGKPRYSSDIYALGMTAIEALTGICPNQLPDDPHTGEVSWRSRAQVRPQFAAILNQMVRSHYKDRYTTVEEVLQDLHRLQLVPATKLTQPMTPPPSPPSVASRWGQVALIFCTIGITLGVSQLFASDRPLQEVRVVPTVPPEIASMPIPTMSPGPMMAAKPTSPTNRTTDLLIQGNVLMELQRYDEAIAAFDQAVKLKPDYPEAWVDLGNALMQVNRYPDALNAYDEALKLQLDDPQTWYYRAVVLNALQRYEEALVALTKARQAGYEETVEGLEVRGVALTALQRYEEALLVYVEAMKFTPRSAQLWYKQGYLLNQLGRHEEALSALNQALELQSDRVEALIERGKTLGELQRYEEALATIDKALPLATDSATGWGERGDLLLKLGRYDEAIAALNKAVQLQADYGKAWFSQGLALEKLQRHEEALKAFDQAVKLQPEDSQAWYRRGVTLERLQKVEEAIASYDKAIQIWPANAEAIESRKYLLQSLGRNE